MTICCDRLSIANCYPSKARQCLSIPMSPTQEDVYLSSDFNSSGNCPETTQRYNQIYVHNLQLFLPFQKVIISQFQDRPGRLLSKITQNPKTSQNIKFRCSDRDNFEHTIWVSIFFNIQSLMWKKLFYDTTFPNGHSKLDYDAEQDIAIIKVSPVFSDFHESLNFKRIFYW